VWAVGRHLSQSSSAADAFAAPGTCKQLTPQIIVICGGARYQPAPQPQADLAPANSTVDRSQSDAHMQQVSKHIQSLGYAYLQLCCSVTLQHSGARILTLGLPRCSGVACTTMQRSKISVHSGFGSVVPTSGHVPYARHVTTVPNPRSHCNCRVLNCGGGNLPTKLSRGCAGAKYLWLGYPGRNSGQTQPDSPLQSPEVPCVRWARGAER
jgi:hypothetical protein